MGVSTSPSPLHFSTRSSKSAIRALLILTLITAISGFSIYVLESGGLESRCFRKKNLVASSPLLKTVASPFKVALIADNCNALMFCRKEVSALGPEAGGEDVVVVRGVVQSWTRILTRGFYIRTEHSGSTAQMLMNFLVSREVVIITQSSCS